jgi:PAS domain S-box-containing protein
MKRLSNFGRAILLLACGLGPGRCLSEAAPGEVGILTNANEGVAQASRQTIASLRRLRLELARGGGPILVRVRGNLLDTRPGEYVVICDSTGTLFAQCEASMMPQANEEIDLEGELTNDGDILRLRHARIRTLDASSSSGKRISARAIRPARLPMLTNVWQARDLPASQAAWNYPVRLRGVVTVNQRVTRFFCLQDESAGISVRMSHVPSELQPGDLVEVDGTTDPGGFSPIILGSNVVVVGHGQLPEPRTASLYQLATGYDGSQWIEVRGVVRSASIRDGLAELNLSDTSGMLSVTVPAKVLPANLLDAVVRICGACGSSSTNRQFLSPVMHASSLDYVHIEEPGLPDPLNQPAQPITAVGEFRPRQTLQHRLTVGGLVSLRESAHSFFLQDSGKAVRVQTTQTNAVASGDYVVVAGYPSIDDYGHMLSDAVCRVLNHSTPLDTDRVPALPSLEPRLHNRWVGLDARLLNINRVGRRSILTLQTQDRIFTAQCPGSLAEDIAGLPVGSLLRLTGVYRVLANEARQPAGFEVVLASRSGIEVLDRPSWWTLTHTATVVGGLALVLAATSLWILLLRRKVGLQTARLERSEQQFRSLVEQSLAGVSILQNGRFSYVSPHQAEMFGATVRDLIEVPIQDVVTPADWPNLEAQLQGAVQGEGQTIRLTFQGRRRDGAPVEIELLGSRTEFAGQPAVLATTLDITERKRAEIALAETSNLLQTLMDHSPDHIYFKDAHSRFVWFSKSFEALFHVPDAKSLLGKTDFDFFLEEHARMAFADEREIMRSGCPLIGKLEREAHPDGRYTWALTTKMPWHDKQGRIIGTFGISKDVTAIKEAEAKVEAAHKRLLEISRLAGMAEVATDVLHNVGNVLNSVNVSCSLAADRLRNSRAPNLTKAARLLAENEQRLPEFLAADPRGRRLPGYLQALGEELALEQSGLLGEIEQVIKHVDHIKQIVAVQQGYARVSGVREAVHLSQLVEDAIQINEVSFARHHVRLVCNFQKLPPVLTERHKVLQVLVNLLSNAKEATCASHREDREVHVITGKSEDGRAKIQVVDNGVGISGENLTRIFAHGFTTRQGGHGFGLHSSALAAHELGGSLRAHSDGAGRGATFTLLLPLDPPDPTPASSLESSSNEGPESQNERSTQVVLDT